MDERNLARAAVLLAIAVLIQQLRIFIPLPPIMGIAIIGTIVNLVLVLAARTIPLRLALGITLLLPMLAYVQGHLFLLVQIPAVFLGNASYVLLSKKLGENIFLWLAPLVKAVIIALGVFWGAAFFGVGEQVGKQFVLVTFGTQFITGLLGLWLGKIIIVSLEGHKII